MGRSSDFKFWEERSPVHRLSCDDESFEFQVGASSSSPETSNLLPENHHRSCLSPTSRLRAIVDGRREMMEMIKNMPESSYELTLKDIVDDKEEVEEKEEEERGKDKRESRSIHKSKQICRSESMESEVFLIKMFLPVSLSFKNKKKKKAKQRKCVKQKSEVGLEKEASKEWWKIIFVAIRDHKHKNTNIITHPTRYAILI